MRRQLSGNFGGILEPVCLICNNTEEREKSWVRVAHSLSEFPSPPGWACPVRQREQPVWSSQERLDKVVGFSHLPMARSTAISVFLLWSSLRPYCHLVPGHRDPVSYSSVCIPRYLMLLNTCFSVRATFYVKLQEAAEAPLTKFTEQLLQTHIPYDPKVRHFP